jgi:(R,R)-butanediol dehydrogenase/meso-butanediol dehydrogenase/diacetyl reductase
VKAVRYYGKEDIRVEEVSAPTGPGPRQIVVKPKVCGICGTDLHEYAAGPIVTPVHPHHFTGAMLPQILGHEFSAEVIEVGKDVTRIRKGERVSIQPLVMPLDDYYSRRGLNHLSPKMGCIGLSWAWGGMGEYAVVNDYNANKLPDSVDVRKLVKPAADAGIQFNPGPEWVCNPEPAKSYMRLCFALTSKEEIREGVASLAQVCYEQTGIPVRSDNVQRRSA